jgi:dUTP pyrophosphatase
MNQIAKFERVSYQQFRADLLEVLGYIHEEITEEQVHEIYDGIRLPTRATVGSAGYDFYAPFSFGLRDGLTGTLRIPTGIRVRIDEGWFLGCLPRSSLGFRYRLQLDNTMGVIDSDYYYSRNEGHILVQLTTTNTQERNAFHANVPMTISRGDRFVQGIFLPYGVTINDKTTALRNGGFGSTNP